MNADRIGLRHVVARAIGRDVRTLDLNIFSRLAVLKVFVLASKHILENRVRQHLTDAASLSFGFYNCWGCKIFSASFFASCTSPIVYF